MRCKITISYRIKQEKKRLSKNHVTLNRAKNLNVQTYGLQILHFVQNDTYMTDAHSHLALKASYLSAIILHT